MSASFRGHSFAEGGLGATTFPAWSRKARLAVLDLPGATADVVQRLGRKSDTLSITATMTAAQLDALMADVDVSGTLIYHYGSYTAVLESISDARGILDADLYVASLTFVRL